MSAAAVLFGDDFRGSSPTVAELRAGAVQAEREEIERQAFARGASEGRREAAAEAERLMADAASRLADAMPAALGELDRAIAAAEADALAFFGALARKLAAGALAERPLAALGDAAAAAFRHLRGVPHLVARVAPGLVEGTDGLLARLAREAGFEGRVIVLGDDEVAAGDVRLEWADGGIVLDRRRIDDAVAALLDRAGRDGAGEGMGGS